MQIIPQPVTEHKYSHCNKEHEGASEPLIQQYKLEITQINLTLLVTYLNREENRRQERRV